MEDDVTEEQGEEKTLEEIQEEFNVKIKKFFETTSYISSRDDFDNFLSKTDLLDIWNSEGEKDILWQYISKYSKNSKIDCDGALKGFDEFIHQDEEGQDEKEEEQNNSTNQKKEEKEVKETLLTRLSRVSNRAIRGKSGNKLALNRYKQRAIEQYDGLDNDSLIQFKKIFTVLKYKIKQGKLNYNDVQETCNRYKFITTDINDIWKYLSYCVCVDDLKNLEGKNELDISNDIMEEVNAFIDQKLINEDIEVNSDNMEEGDELGDDGEGDKGLEENTLDLVDKIIKEAVNINENNLVLNEIKKEINTINKSGNYNSKELVNEKINQIDEFIKKSQKENETNINKMESLKNNILKISEKIRIMNEDYTALYEKYQNNQQYDLDEESNRLVDENIMLSKENENKQLEIDNLLEEQKQIKKEYQNILMQYEDAIREKNELNIGISELKLNNYKLKSDYDKLLNDIVAKTEKEKKNKKSNKESNIPYEEQVKQLKSINNSKIDEGEKITRKKTIFDSMTNDKLINYIMEVERINQTLTNEKNKKDQKIHELTQKNVDLNSLMKIVKDRNIDLEEEAKNLQKKIDNLNNEVRNNEIFRPSIAMNSQTRISRLSKLNTVGINQQKFNVTKGGGFSNNKKKVEKLKLKDLDNEQNLRIGKTPTLKRFENISMDLYGVKEVEDEEEDQENKNNSKNKNNMEFSTNKSGINIEGKNNENNIGISSNKGFGINDPKNKNNKMGVGGFGQFNFGNKNNNKNAFGINSNNININNKFDLELKSASSGMLFDGTNNDINLSQQQSGELNININSISSGDNNSSKGGLTSSIVQFDIQNNNNTINNNNTKFETINNNNMFIQNENKNGNNGIGAQSGIFFESKPENKNTIKKENANNDDIQNLKIDSLMGEMIENDNNNKNEEELDYDDNLKINEIKNENLERNTSVIVNEISGQNQNLENSIFNGIQKEGFNINNSPMKGSLSSTNDNNINIEGGDKNEIYEIKNKNESNISLNKSKENDISMSSISNKNEKDISLDQSKNNFSINKSKNINQNNKDSIDQFKINSISNNNDNNKFDIFSDLSESNAKPIEFSRLSKVELDELRNNNYDYYSLFGEEIIQRKLHEQNDKCHEFNVYSDQIYLVTEKKHLSKRYIFMTPSHVYIIEPKEMKFTRVIKKEEIRSFKITNKNTNILMFEIAGGDNILIETLRRMDLLSYLKETYRNNKTLITIKFQDYFEVKIKGKTQKILVKDKIFSNLSNFDGAQKIGYLFVYIGTYIVPIFKEKLFVLTSIGLIMFDEPSSPPSKLYPIIGSVVEKIEGTKYNRENCFKVTLLSGKVKIFSTRKKRERDSWLEEFKKIITEFNNKMRQLDTQNKKLIDNIGKKGA